MLKLDTFKQGVQLGTNNHNTFTIQVDKIMKILTLGNRDMYTVHKLANNIG